MDANILGTQISAAAIAVWVIQNLKKSKYYPLLSQKSGVWAKRAHSIVAAILVHTGISGIWNHGTPPPGYQYQLILNFPPILVMLVTFGHYIQQFVFQELGFQITYNRVSLTSSPDGPVLTPKITSAGAVVVPNEPTK